MIASCNVHSCFVLQLPCDHRWYQLVFCIANTQLATIVAPACKHQPIFGNENVVPNPSCDLQNRLILQLSSQQCRHQPVLCDSHTQLTIVVAAECEYCPIFSHAHGLGSDHPPQAKPQLSS